MGSSRPGIMHAASMRNGQSWCCLTPAYKNITLVHKELIDLVLFNADSTNKDITQYTTRVLHAVNGRQDNTSIQFCMKFFHNKATFGYLQLAFSFTVASCDRSMILVTLFY